MAILSVFFFPFSTIVCVHFKVSTHCAPVSNDKAGKTMKDPPSFEQKQDSDSDRLLSIIEINAEQNGVKTEHAFVTTTTMNDDEKDEKQR